MKKIYIRSRSVGIIAFVAVIGLLAYIQGNNAYSLYKEAMNYERATVSYDTMHAATEEMIDNAHGVKESTEAYHAAKKDEAEAKELVQLERQLENDRAGVQEGFWLTISLMGGTLLAFIIFCIVTKISKCPFCLENVKPKARLCKHCGRELPQQEKTFTFSCPRCGQHMSTSVRMGGNDAACPTCNHPFVIPSPSA